MNLFTKPVNTGAWLALDFRGWYWYYRVKKILAIISADIFLPLQNIYINTQFLLWTLKCGYWILAQSIYLIESGCFTVKQILMSKMTWEFNHFSCPVLPPVRQDTCRYRYICDTPISDNLYINQALVTTVVKMDTRCVLGTIFLFCFGGFWLCSCFDPFDYHGIQQSFNLSRSLAKEVVSATGDRPPGKHYRLITM